MVHRALCTALLVALAGVSAMQQPPDDPREVDPTALTLIGRDDRPPDDDVAVARALDNFHDAAAHADFDRYFGYWSDQSVFMGTDASERWVGQEFKDFARPYFDQGKGWKYIARDRHVTVSAEGSVAWFDELLDNEKYGVCRGSGVLLREGKGWKIVQYNLAFMVPNDLADKVTGLIRDGAKAK